jgi:hypothetical protein
MTSPERSNRRSSDFLKNLQSTVFWWGLRSWPVGR